MKHKEFKKVLTRRLYLTKYILDKKNKEYASNDDKLHNFNRAGNMLNVSPEQALIGMWTKHIVSLLDIVDNINNYGDEELIKICNGEGLTKEMLEEKIGDAINYLVILEAMIKNRYGWVK